MWQCITDPEFVMSLCEWYPLASTVSKKFTANSIAASHISQASCLWKESNFWSRLPQFILGWLSDWFLLASFNVDKSSLENMRKTLKIWPDFYWPPATSPLPKTVEIASKFAPTNTDTHGAIKFYSNWVNSKSNCDELFAASVFVV